METVTHARTFQRPFPPRKKNYEIYDRELLAIIRALEEWWHYIQGSPHTTTILSDHKNLTYYREARKLNWRQARWSLYLSEFDAKLVHTPGHKMILSDALSWQPDFVPEEDDDNNNLTMLPDNLFIDLIDVDLQKRIANCETLDKDATDALALLIDQGPTTVKNQLNDWTMETLTEKQFCFSKEKTISLKTINYDATSQKHSMITKRLATQGNSKRSTPLTTTTGGQVYKPSLRTTWKDAEPVNNLKLTVNRPNCCFNPRKARNLPNPLATALWTLSLIYPP